MITATLRPIKAEEVSFICPVTGMRGYDLYPERDESQASVMVYCGCEEVFHVVDLSAQISKSKKESEA